MGEPSKSTSRFTLTSTFAEREAREGEGRRGEFVLRIAGGGAVSVHVAVHTKFKFSSLNSAGMLDNVIITNANATVTGVGEGI